MHTSQIFLGMLLESTNVTSAYAPLIDLATLEASVVWKPPWWVGSTIPPRCWSQKSATQNTMVFFGWQSGQHQLVSWRMGSQWMSMIRITHIFFSPFKPFGRGPTTQSLGDLRSPWLLTTQATKKNPYYLPLYWLLNRDPYIGLSYIPHILTG